MTNPKQAFGNKKPPLATMPLPARVEASYAFLDGTNKYGFHNWRKSKVEAMTYIHAIERHAMLYACGQQRTSDTNVHNLGAIIACCSILLDAELNGQMIDDRPISPEAVRLLEEGAEMVSALNELQAKRDIEKALAASAEARAALPTYPKDEPQVPIPDDEDAFAVAMGVKALDHTPEAGRDARAYHGMTGTLQDA